MKKSALFLLSALGASALFAGTSMEVVGGISGKRVSIPSGDYDVILKPNADTPSQAYFATNSSGKLVTINSLTTEGTPDLWDIAYGLTIDVKNSSSDVIENVLVNNGKMQWRINGVTFKNSLGNSATAKINLGEEFRLVHNNGAQSTWLAFSMNANVEGTYLNSVGYARTGLKADNGSTINWNVERSRFAQLNSGVYVSGNSTFNNTGAMEFGANTRLDVESGSTFNTTVASTFASGSQLNVAGNYNYTGTSSVTFGGDVNVSGSFVAKDLDVKLGTNGRITFNGATTFAAGSSGDFNGAMVIGKTFAVESGSNGITLRDLDTTYRGRIMLNYGAELTLGKENAFKRITSEGKESNVNLLIMSKNTKIILNASNKFDQLFFSGTNNSVDVVLDDSSTLLFQGMSSTSETGNYLNISNFEDNRIFFIDKGNAEKCLTITATTKDGKTLTMDELQLVAGQYAEGINGYWLNVVAVPEPSSYALVLGAIAIAFALKRRCSRK